MSGILILTTGGTIDKLYFDALSEFRIGDSVVAQLLAIARVKHPFRLLGLMRKDSLDLTDEDRRLIADTARDAPESRLIITHGTDTMTDTAQALAHIAGKTIVLVGALAPARFAESDAAFNLGLAFATAQVARAGVWITMNGSVFAAGRVRKDRGARPSYRCETASRAKTDDLAGHSNSRSTIGARVVQKLRVTSDRSEPDALPPVAARDRRGRLKVYLGAAPGVGKTYEMLCDAAARRDAGLDVTIGVVETHGRPETQVKAQGFAVIPCKPVAGADAGYEVDIDAIIARRPALVLVDELAHTNAPGSRHDKRYQDVEELLAAGIDVWSTLSIHHLESLNDIIASFTQVRVRETMPDNVLDDAEIEIVDIPPDELIARLHAGKVFISEETTRAVAHFFSPSNLSAMRELTLRRAAQAVDVQMLEHVRANALTGSWGVNDRLVVAVSEHPGSAGLVRAGKRVADALHAPWTAVHIDTPRSAGYSEQESGQLAATMHLAAQLGAKVASVPAVSVIEGLLRVTAEARTTQLVIGKMPRSRWFELRHGSVVDRLVRESPGMAVHVLPLESVARAPAPARGTPQGWGTPMGYALSLALSGLTTLAGIGVAALGHVTNIALLYLLPVLFAAICYGLATGVVTALVCSLAFSYFFVRPAYSFTLQDPQNLITLGALTGLAYVSSRLAARMRVQAMLAQRSAGQNASLAGFARLMAGANSSEELGEVLCAEAARLLAAHAVLLMTDGEELQRVAAVPSEDQLQALDRAAARWACEKNRPAGRGSDTLTASEWLFHPIAAGGKVRAVLGLARPEAPAPVRSDQLPMLLSLLDQAGMAFQRIALEAELARVTRL